MLASVIVVHCYVKRWRSYSYNNHFVNRFINIATNSLLLFQVYVRSCLSTQAGHCLLYRRRVDCQSHENMAVSSVHHHFCHCIAYWYWHWFDPCRRAGSYGRRNVLCGSPRSGFWNSPVRHLLRDLEERQDRHPSVLCSRYRLLPYVRITVT